MRVPWLSMPLLIMFILNFPIFFFCALSMTKKPLDVLKEKRNITARSPDDNLDPPDLMTYVLRIFFLFVLLLFFFFFNTLATLDRLSS